MADGTNSSAVGYGTMEPYGSTLIVTALAVCGLVTAARILHPGNYEERLRPKLAIVTTAARADTPSPWADPPVRSRGAEPAAPIAGATAVLAPRLTMAPPPGTRMASPLPGTLVRTLAPSGGMVALEHDATAAAPGIEVRKIAADPVEDRPRNPSPDRDG